MKPDSLPDNKFLLYNLAGLGTTIEASYDANSQTISIPQQIIYKHETFGEFSILPLAIKDGGLYITDGAIEGVLNNDGSINMGIWGVIVTQKNDGVPSEYYGKALSVFTSTIARKSNATHTYQNPLDSLKTEVLPILALQTSPYKMEIQGLTAKANSEILHARISSTGKMIISPQVIFTHSTYGDFKCYPVKYVTEADQLKYILDKQGVIEFTINGTNAQAEGMIVAGSVAPSKYISSMYKGLNIDFSIPPSIPSSTGSEFTGKGTEESPYIISNVSDYIRLAENVEAGDSFAGKYFKLDNDLDFASSPEGAIIPIGTPTQPFEGNFNGNNHTIMNISMDRNGFLLTALFGNLGKTGKISNLNIKDSQFKSIGDYIGTVAAYCSGTISNCHIFNCKLEGEGLLTGGIARLSSGGKIENCSFNGQISGKESVGGIVGQALAGSTIIKCNSAGKLTHEGEIDITACDLAGICGTLKESTISECYSSGSISDNYGRARVGGLIGRSLQGLTERSFTTAVITAKRAANDENADSYTGGIVAYTLESEFNDCYSSSSIIKTQVSETIGGICGNLTVSYVSSAGTAYQMIRQTYFRRCFYTGQMRTPISNPKRGLYGTTFIIPEYTGPSPEDLCFIDCWYDGQVNFLSESKYGKKTSQVTESALQNYDSNIWEFIPGYYPALKAFGSDNKVQAVAKAPLVLRNEDTAKKVRQSFKTSVASNIKWTLLDKFGYYVNELPSVILNGNEATIKDSYDNAPIMAITDDKTAHKIYILGITPKVFEGDGSQESPYLLKNIDDFKLLDKAVGVYGQDHKNDYFRITSDIDFNSDATFLGIGGGSGYAFSGAIDGNNHKISGLNIDACKYDDTGKAISGIQFTGFVGVLGEGGEIKNITITPDNKFTFYSYAGAITGTNLGTIDGCRNYADVKILGQYAGGIAGFNSVNSTIKNSYNSGNIQGGSSFFGGIIGLNIGGPGIRTSFEGKKNHQNSL